MRFGRLSRLFATLRFRLTFWNTVAILLMLGAMMIGTREGLRYTLMHELDQLLAEDALEVTLDVQRNYPDCARISEFLERKSASHSEHGWFGQLLGPDGQPRAASSSVPIEQTTPFGKRVTRTIGNHRLVDEPLELRGAPGMTVRVGANLTPIRDDIRRLTTMLLSAGAVILFVAPLGGYWLAGRATRLLKEIIRSAARLHPNRLNERLPSRGTGDELDQLSATINGSLDRIADHIARQREFVANAAHELRSPLTALRALVDVALQRDRSGDEYRDLLGDLAEESDELGRLINRLLLLAEGEAGLLQNGQSVEDLGRIAVQTAAMFQGVAEQRGIELRTAINMNVLVHGDATHLRQVVQNLLDNALKFTPVGGTVYLETAMADDGAILRIRDSGPGIPPADLPHVFDRFFRGDRSRHRNDGGGTGLGLSICYSIVQSYGGSIVIESTTGVGTTATVRFPIVVAELTKT